MPKDTDVPGNTLLSQALLDRQVNAIGVAMVRLDSRIEKMRGEGHSLVSIRLVAPSEKSTSWLAVIKLRTVEGAFVAFHQGDELSDLLKGVSNRMLNNSLKWKADEYE